MRTLATAIVYSNIWVAAGAALLTAQTFWVRGQQTSWWLVAFVFFASLATYNFQRMLRIDKWWLRAKSVRLHWLIQSQKFIVTLIVLSLFGAGLCAWYALNPLQILLVMPLGAIAILYAWRVFPTQSGRLALRDLPGTKVWWIGLSWALVTAGLPLLNSDLPSASVALPILAERMFFIVAITIPFDVRDLAFDHPRQKTLPQWLGVRTAVVIAMCCALCYLLIALWAVVNGAYASEIIPAILAVFTLTIISLLFAFRPRQEWYYGFLLDGLTLAQPTLVWWFIR